MESIKYSPLIVLLSEAERSEKDLVLPKRNSGSETRDAKLRKEREESQKLVEAVVKGLLENAAAGKPEVELDTPIQTVVVQSK